MDISEIKTIIKNNPEVLSTHERARAFFADVFLNDLMRINVMMNAYDVGIIDAISSSNSFTKNQMVSGIISIYGISENLAKEAVDFWASILTPDVLAITGPIINEGKKISSGIPNSNKIQKAQQTATQNPVVCFSNTQSIQSNMQQVNGGRIRYCEHCGSDILNGEKYCYKCGAPAPQPIQTPIRDNQRVNQQQAAYPEPVAVNAPKPIPTYTTYNSLANASFILGIVALVLGWVPILDIFLLIASTVVSIIALIKIKKGKYSWKPITALVLTVVSFIASVTTIY